MCEDARIGRSLLAHIIGEKVRFGVSNRESILAVGYDSGVKSAKSIDELNLQGFIEIPSAEAPRVSGRGRTNFKTSNVRYFCKLLESR